MSDTLKNFLKILTEQNLITRRDKIIKVLQTLAKTVEDSKSDIDDIILQCITENRYNDAHMYLDMQTTIQNVVTEITCLYSDSNISSITSKTSPKDQPLAESVSPTPEEPFLQIMTSTDQMGVGDTLAHMKYGYGTITKFEETDNGKRMFVLFADGQEKQFRCTPEVLKQYFKIETPTDNEENPTHPSTHSSIRPSVPFKDLGIPVGAQLIFYAHGQPSNITAQVVDNENNKISYKGKTASMSAIAKQLLHNKEVKGSRHFQYNNKTIETLQAEYWRKHEQ